MSLSPRIEDLIEALRCLPGVGRKSAQRMALHLLERDREGGRHLANSLQDAITHVRQCLCCRNHSETDICQTCQNPRKDASKLCIVETPADVMAINQSTGYDGLYFVLMGHLSPIDGIGPEQLGLPALMARIRGDSSLSMASHENTDLGSSVLGSSVLGGSDFERTKITEVIIATNPTVEGEATAHYIHEHIKSLNHDALQVSRIAHGVPMGGELEYIDGGTLAHAFAGRQAW